jgi:hypothetical protein
MVVLIQVERKHVALKQLVLEKPRFGSLYPAHTGVPTHPVGELGLAGRESKAGTAPDKTELNAEVIR